MKESQNGSIYLMSAMSEMTIVASVSLTESTPEQSVNGLCPVNAAE